MRLVYHLNPVISIARYEVLKSSRMMLVDWYAHVNEGVKYKS